jgi:putative ABC transport system permease protein
MNRNLSLVISLVLGLILLFSFTEEAQASGGDTPIEKKVQEVDGYEVQLGFVAGKALTGDNEIQIELHDAQDQPVSDARVIITAEMSAVTGKKMGMGTQTESTSNGGANSEEGKEVELKAGKEPGEYEGEVEFDDEGQWLVKVQFAVQGQEKSTTFAVDVIKAGPNWYVLWGFLVVNIAIITVAAVTRRKQVVETAQMKLYRMVTKDIIRRKRRVLYAALGITIGTMTVVGILTIALAGQVRIYNQLEKYGPNLTVIPEISNLDMKLGDLSMGTLAVGENYVPAEKLPQIREITDGEIKMALNIDDEGEIATIAPKLYVNTKLNNTSIMVVGIDPEPESRIKTWWKIGSGGYLDGAEDQAMAGATVAELLKLNVKDTIALNGQTFSIAGILETTGSNDDYQIFVPLKASQRVFGKEGLISSVDIRALCNACPVETIADELNKNMSGIRAIAVKQVASTEMGMIEKINKLMLALAGITLAIGLFGVINTMMASIHERMKDIGIMRAVGASRNQIIKVFIYEAIFIGIVGGIFGYVAGTLLAYGIGPIIFEGTTISAVPQYLPLALILAILVAVIAAIYPAYTASKIRVADLFRSL